MFRMMLVMMIVIALLGGCEKSQSADEPSILQLPRLTYNQVFIV